MEQQSRQGRRHRLVPYGLETAARGMILIAYFTLMRPLNNWALTWEEVALDPLKGTGNFELDRHKNVNKGIRAYGRLAVRWSITS